MSLIPTMGEIESRATKLLLTDLWPYSLLYWKWDAGKLRMLDPQNIEFGLVLARERERVPLYRAYIDAKVAAATPTVAVPDESEDEPTVEDLMASLRANVERARQERDAGGTPT